MRNKPSSRRTMKKSKKPANFFCKQNRPLSCGEPNLARLIKIKHDINKTSNKIKLMTYNKNFKNSNTLLYF